MDSIQRKAIPFAPKAISLPAETVRPLQNKDSAATQQRIEAGKAAEQFETMMAQQLLKSMEQGLPGGNLVGEGVAGDIYNGMAEWELAKVLARNAHFGLKEQILRQLPKGEETGK
jgi:Rod binding domain-containing protein